MAGMQSRTMPSLPLTGSVRPFRLYMMKWCEVPTMVPWILTTSNGMFEGRFTTLHT
jgi:hypothetical protein